MTRWKQAQQESIHWVFQLSEQRCEEQQGGAGTDAKGDDENEAAKPASQPAAGVERARSVPGHEGGVKEHGERVPFLT